ncbi:aldehyde dehydrogenase family protein [Nocardia sp. NPDC050193]
MTTTADSATTAWRDALFDGDFRPVSRTLTVVSPATGAVLDTVGEAGTAELETAVRSATAAQLDWAARTYDERVAVPLRAAQLLGENPARLGSAPGWLPKRDRGRVRRPSRSVW